MPTAKPRIQVTVSEEQYALLKRLSALQGVSMSSIVSEMVETVSEPLQRVLQVLEAADKAPEQVKQGLRAAVEAAERDFMPAAHQALDHFGSFIAAVEGASSEGGAGDAKAADAPGADDAQPPYSNTGVRSTKRGKQGGSGRAL